MQDYMKTLNPQQYEAATTLEGPLLILAGAGSGKTGTMTHRIAYMIKEAGVNPYSILAVTFTNKAAGEMRDRVEALVGPAPGMWIQTFHSACLRILRMDADRIGYDRNFVVYDPVDQKTLVKQIVKELEYDEKQFAPAYVLAEISKAKEDNVTAPEFARKYGTIDRYQPLVTLYDRYDKALKKNNAMDFDDLILNTVRLFEGDEETLLKYQKRFRYVMVDEYQDTNMLQYRLVKMLAEGHRNLCVVGDDDQCIYQWRGADIRNILEFEKDFPGAKVIKLEQNYRSTGNIIDAAHSVISRNRSRKAKKLWTEAAPGEKIEYYRASDDREEARWTAEKIRSLMHRDPDLTYSDFAILYRTNVQSRRFEESLSGRDIPYQVLSGLRYYDRKEIKDMMAYMRLILNPADDVALLRILNEPKRGIGAKTEEKLRAAAAASGRSLLQTLSDPAVQDSLSARSEEAVKALTGMLSSLALEQERMSVEDIYDTLLNSSGYLKALQDAESIEADARIENLLEFKSVIAEKQKETDALQEVLTLERFMEGLALLSDVDNHRADQDAVVLMTLHSAKGLEFPVVFMPGMELGIFPSWRTLDSGDGSRMEEERRLCYVGMTRAKKRLFLSSAEMRMLYGKTDFTSESTFLKEIDPKYLAGDALYTKRGQGVEFGRYDVKKPYSGSSYVSPIAQANALRQSALGKKRDTLAGVSVAAGEKVEHAKFGKGTVLEASGNTLTVYFDSVGVKKMAKDLAPLKKI
ncbi:MAG: UvrD-helicase domain-containing protein [Clostridia bacterium]|nr:UvrD-helicase domain-containing protein [Clostridia bacterium]